MNPGDPDDDNDGSSDIDEFNDGTDPFDPDTDGDGIIDSLDRSPLSVLNNICFGLGADAVIGTGEKEPLLAG